MNTIILATVLLVALSAFTQFTNAEVDEAKFEKCLEDELDRQVKVEIPTEVRLAREHFDSLGIDRVLYVDFQAYKASLNEEQQNSLKEAANRYVDETMAVILDDPCANLKGYTKWSANREPKDTATKAKLFRFKNLAIRIVAFLDDDD